MCIRDRDTDRPVENQALIAPSNVRNPFVTISLYGCLLYTSEGREKLFFRKVFPPFPNAFHQPCFLKLFLGRERQKASTTRAMVTQNMMAESALMSGFTPSRTIE